MMLIGKLNRTICKVIFFFFCFSYTQSKCLANKDNEHILCITVPKSGTHLLIKCLSLFNIDGIKYNFERIGIVKQNDQKFQVDVQNYNIIKKKTTIDYQATRIIAQINKHINNIDKKSFVAHLPFNKQSKNFFKRNFNKGFLMIRDPRDQIVSLANTIVYTLPKDLNIDFNDVLLDLILARQHSKLPQNIAMKNVYKLISSIGIKEYYKNFLQWAKSSNIYLVKFENLVGIQGGGNAEDQSSEINKIAQHLGIKLNKEQIDHVVNNLFGNTWTFREGKIGSWRNSFTSEIKAAFKSIDGANQLLIDLGYEIDENW